MRPISLHKDRLNEQVKEHRLLVTEIETHRSSFESVKKTTATFIANPDHSRVARKLESTTKDLISRQVLN